MLGIDANGTPHYHVLNMKATHKLWDIPDGQRIVLEYNPAWQPMGESANKFRGMTGKFIRSGNYIRLSDEWKNVSNQAKEYIWDTLMVCLIKYYCIL